LVILTLFYTKRDEIKILKISRAAIGHQFSSLNFSYQSA